jgi:hypothetical protein
MERSCLKERLLRDARAKCDETFGQDSSGQILACDNHGARPAERTSTAEAPTRWTPKQQEFLDAVRGRTFDGEGLQGMRTAS